MSHRLWAGVTRREQWTVPKPSIVEHLNRRSSTAVYSNEFPLDNLGPQLYFALQSYFGLQHDS
jgi:hypothetical protein